MTTVAAWWRGRQAVWRHSTYPGSPDDHWSVRVVRAGVRVIVNTPEFASFHRCAKGKTQLRAHDMRVQCKLFRVVANPIRADAAPSALSEDLHSAKVDAVAGSSRHNGGVERHEAHVPLCRWSGRCLTAYTSPKLPQGGLSNDALLPTKLFLKGRSREVPIPERTIAMYVHPVSFSVFRTQVTI